MIVGTHGNLRIFRKLGWLFFSCLKVVVFDEADHMMDREGFGDDTTVMVETVDEDTKENGLPPPQLLMFSATYRNDLKAFAKKLCFGRETQQVCTSCYAWVCDIVFCRAVVIVYLLKQLELVFLKVFFIHLCQLPSPVPNPWRPIHMNCFERHCIFVFCVKVNIMLGSWM